LEEIKKCHNTVRKFSTSAAVAIGVAGINGHRIFAMWQIPRKIKKLAIQSTLDACRLLAPAACASINMVGEVKLRL
jgi:hypothetical protein